MSKQDKNKSLELAILQIEKDHGSEAIMRLGAKTKSSIDRISTGSLSLDECLGGGIPEGRVIEIYGPESSGKTTLTLHVIAEAQKKGGLAAFIDAEHALDPSYARKLGVDTDNLLLSQPDTGEQALDITETLVRSGALKVIVIDSVAALVPKAELDGDMGDSHMGLQARLMSQALRKLTGSITKSNTSVIWLSNTFFNGVVNDCIYSLKIIKNSSFALFLCSNFSESIRNVKKFSELPEESNSIVVLSMISLLILL